MKKHIKFIILLFFMALMSLACSFSMEGINWGDDPSEMERLIQQETVSALTYEENTANIEEEPAAMVEPATQLPLAPVANTSNAKPDGNGEKDYSVSATNFGCTCQVDGNTITAELKIEGDQLEYAGNMYNRISENTYERSYMGYYILVSGEGDQKTETKVDEERSDVIIITPDGFISEHYQGTDGSPCCYHTFTIQK